MITLQNLLGQPIAVGGEAALRMPGHNHYLNFGEWESVYQYGPQALHAWVTKVPCNAAFHYCDSRKLWPDASPTAQSPIVLQDWICRDLTLPHGLRRMAGEAWE